MAVSAIFWTTVNAFDKPSDERVLQAPNNWSQPGPTSVRPGWLLLAHALERPRVPSARLQFRILEQSTKPATWDAVIGRCSKCHNNRISEIALLCRKRVSVTVRIVTGDPVTSESQPRSGLALP